VRLRRPDDAYAIQRMIVSGRGHVDHYDYETRNNGRYDDNCINQYEQVIGNKYLNIFSSLTIYINIPNNQK